MDAFMVWFTNGLIVFLSVVFVGVMFLVIVPIFIIGFFITTDALEKRINKDTVNNTHRPWIK